MGCSIHPAMASSAHSTRNPLTSLLPEATGPASHLRSCSDGKDRASHESFWDLAPESSSRVRHPLGYEQRQRRNSLETVTANAVDRNGGVIEKCISKRCGKESIHSKRKSSHNYRKNERNHIDNRSNFRSRLRTILKLMRQKILHQES